jgi:AraC family transcriptional regulator
MNKNTIPHPENFYKDTWVLSRKSIDTAGLIVDLHSEDPDEIEINEATNHHIMSYLIKDPNSRAIVRMNGKEFDGICRDGDFCLKPNNSDVFWLWKGIHKVLAFAIAPDFLSQVAIENHCLNPDKIEILPILQSRDSQLDRLVMLFQREMEHFEFAESTYIDSLANLYAIHLLRHYCAFPATLKEYSGGLPPYKLKQAIDYINDHLDSKIKLDDLASLIGLSSFYFCHLFKESTGIAPYKYIIKQRIEKAKVLIKTSKLTIAEIALECGFSSQSQMTQRFSKCVGVTPKVYRDR